MSRTPDLCVVTIGFTKVALPIDAGLKIVGLLKGGVEVERRYIRDTGADTYKVSGPIDVELCTARANQFTKPVAPPPAPRQPKQLLLADGKTPYVMQLVCPCCHAQLPLEAALQDEAGRELVAMLAAMQPELARPLVHYLGYFRPAKQQLGWGRALRLAREAQALCAAPDDLTAALIEVARAMDDKRAQTGWKPLGNHNYLARVLESTTGRSVPGAGLPAAEARAARTPSSKTGQALVDLEAMKR